MKESLEHVLHLIMFMLLIDVSVCVYCLKVHVINFFSQTIFLSVIQVVFRFIKLHRVNSHTT